ncbi:MAG: hypothetical protein K8M05_24445, partial [Deltaproteobacteria bacterium]|nr:hypothetical protein [Kofleriaceae bacterium]
MIAKHAAAGLAVSCVLGGVLGVQALGCKGRETKEQRPAPGDEAAGSAVAAAADAAHVSRPLETIVLDQVEVRLH